LAILGFLRINNYRLFLFLLIDFLLSLFLVPVFGIGKEPSSPKISIILRIGQARRMGQRTRIITNWVGWKLEGIPNFPHIAGYSTAVGDFDGDKVDDVVVGVPRGNELIGMVQTTHTHNADINKQIVVYFKVSIYTRDLRPIANLTEKPGQRGQYFGASVAVLDLVCPIHSCVVIWPIQF
jgi:hypothetical protein